MPKVYWADSLGQLYHVDETLGSAYLQAKERVEAVSVEAPLKWYVRTLKAIGSAAVRVGSVIVRHSEHMLGSCILSSCAMISSLEKKQMAKKEQEADRARSELLEVEKRIHRIYEGAIPSGFVKYDAVSFESVSSNDKILTEASETIDETTIQTVRERAFTAYRRTL